MFYRFFKPLFFAFPPELMHTFVATLMRFVYGIPPLRALVRKMFSVRHPALERLLVRNTPGQQRPDERPRL